MSALEERFWSKVDKQGPIPEHRPELGPCWIWIGCKDNEGYGRFYIHHDSYIRANRYALIIKNGYIKQWALHHCDNPSCVRLDHLYDGDQKDNTRDFIERKRFVPQKGELNHYARVTEKIVRKIRKLYNTGNYSQLQLANMFNVSRGCITGIIHNINWKHVK